MENHVVEDTLPDTQKLQRKFNSTVLDNFTKLTHNKEQIRIKSGKFLINHLIDSGKQDTNEVKYALNRLVRGLGSSRVIARVGFYSTLVALLHGIPTITIDEVLECLKKHLQTAGSNSKGEKGDIFAGQILACGAVVRSGSYSKATEEQQKAILDYLINAGKKRTYLTLVATTFLADLLDKINEAHFKAVVWPAIETEVLKPWSDQTVDNVYLLFHCHDKFPNIINGKILKSHFGNAQILCEENVKEICDVLMNIPSASHLKHPCYEYISKEIATSNFLLEFTQQISTHLSKPTRNKLLASTLILTVIISNITDKTSLPDILTDNYIKQTLNYFRSTSGNRQDNEFKQVIHKLFEALITCIKSEDVTTKTKISILKKLMFYPGTMIFEKLTKSKLIQQIIATLDGDGIKKLAKVYMDVILTERENFVEENVAKTWLNNDRIYAAQLLVKLLGHPSMLSELEWKGEQLKFLLDMGITRHQKVGTELSEKLKETFFRALDHKFLKLEDMKTLLSQLVHHVNAIITSENNGENVIRVSLNEEELAIWQKMFEQITKLGHKTKVKHSTNVFHVLFLHMGLQLFNDRQLAISSLEELFSCFGRIRNDRKSKGNISVEDMSDANDPLWIEVVVELFLSLLSHNSHLLRKIICCVFPHLCKYMTPSSLQQILSVLDPKNDTNPLSASNETDSEAELDEGEVEEQPTNGDAKESEESDEETSDDETDNETTSDKLRLAVSQALGNNGYPTDEESIDLDQMSDSEATKLDDALAQAFKQFKPNHGKKSRKQNKDDQTLTHFRVRVLDLIEIYLDSEPPMMSCVEIMLPLLQTFEFSIRDEHQIPLKERLTHCLRKLSNIKKFSMTEDVSETVVCDLMSSLLDKGTKNALIVQEMADMISASCIFFIRCSMNICKSETTPKKTQKKLRAGVTKIVTNALETFFKKRDCLIPIVFFKSALQLNWDGNLEVPPVLFDFAFAEEIRPFRKSQALELLKIFYMNQRFVSQNREICEIALDNHELTFSENVINYLENNQSQAQIKEKFVCNLLQLLVAMKSSELQNRNVNWDAIGEKIRQLRSTVTFSKDARLAYNKLCTKLKIPHQVEKRKAVVLDEVEEVKDEEDEEEERQTRKEAKHRHKTNRKLKKETQMMRIQSLSEGFSNSFAFSDVNVSKINLEEGGSDFEHENKKFKKAKRSGEKERKKNKRENSASESQVDSAVNLIDLEQSLTKKHKKRKESGSSEDAGQSQNKSFKKKRNSNSQ